MTPAYLPFARPLVDEAMIAAVAEIDGNGRIARARIAVGACSEVAQRLPALEAALRGLAAERVARETAVMVRAQHLNDLTPIDDVRGSGAYRRDAALTLVRRALEHVLA